MVSKAKKIQALPQGWREVKLGEVASVKTGPFGAQLHQNDYVKSNGTPIVTVEHLHEFGVIHKNLPLVSDYDKKRLKQFIVSKGDILFSRVGSVDRCSLVSKKEDGWLFSGRLLRIKPQETVVHSPYLVYFFRTEKFKHYARSVAVGGTMPSLNTSILSGISVRFPLLPEQKAIASLLEKWDTAIEKTEAIIVAKKKRFDWLRFTLIESCRSETYKLEELEESKVVKMGRGNVISKKDFENIPGGYPIYSSSVKNHGLFGKYGKFMFDQELITWSVDGGGDFFYRHKHKFSVTNVCGYMMVDNKKVNYYFLAAQLQQLHTKLVFDYQFKAHPSVIRKIYKVKLPPLAKQQHIANTLKTAQDEIDLLKQLAEQYRIQKHGLMQKLLTGKQRIQNG